jgi:glycosyltransferase EpsF
MNTTHPVRVLQIVDTLGVGGAETWLMELLRFWRRQGANAPQMDVLVTSGNEGQFDDEARELGAKIFYLRFGRSHLASFVHGWREILRRGSYAAIHDHQEFASGWHFLAGIGCLPSVRIAHVHNPLLGYESNYGVTAGRRLTASAGWRLVDRLATHLCGTSAKILREHNYELGQANSPQVSVIHCGFDVGNFNRPRVTDRASVLLEFGLPPDAKIVLSVGRIDRALRFDHPQNHKNSWFALNVVRAAAERDHSVRYLLAGAGGGRPAMETCIADWGLSDKLRFIGLRSDVPRLMRAADVLLFPSVDEGLGMVAVEAQAAALPVLASTAVPEECIVVPELYNAMSLREPVELWATALLEILMKRRPSLGVCRQALESSNFSIVNSARNLIEIYSLATP